MLEVTKQSYKTLNIIPVLPCPTYLQLLWQHSHEAEAHFFLTKWADKFLWIYIYYILPLESISANTYHTYHAQHVSSILGTWKNANISFTTVQERMTNANHS